MSTLEVLKKGAPKLRITSEPVSSERFGTPELEQLVEDMIETMKLENGVGIAAPQVGVNDRIIIVDDGKKIDAYINPKIISTSDKMIESEEGCLSVPGVFGIVKRHKKVKLKALDRHGKPVRVSVSGFPAIVFQHEIDHLNGILFIDKVEKLTSGENDPLI